MDSTLENKGFDYEACMIRVKRELSEIVDRLWPAYVAVDLINVPFYKTLSDKANALCDSGKSPRVFGLDRERLHMLNSLHHGIFWHALDWMKITGSKTMPDHGGGVYASFLLLLKRMLGLDFTIKLMEYRESILKRELAKKPNLPASVKRILTAETDKEGKIEAKLLTYSPVLRNIRDVIFGMNDGLVEILAATAGIGAALQQPTLVLAAGMIVAISGTLSMAGGAYLSTDYGNTIGMKEDSNFKVSSPRMSAFYVGVSYIFGSIFPLIPFMLGASGYSAIAYSILLTAIVLVFSSTVISVVSDTAISERVAKTLLITLGISAITITLGIFARSYLHLAI